MNGDSTPPAETQLFTLRKTRTPQTHPFDSIGPSFLVAFSKLTNGRSPTVAAGAPLLPATGTTGVLPAKELASSCVFAPGPRRIGAPGRSFAVSGRQMGCPTWLEKD